MTRSTPRAGFTLVEMLVATAIVVLIMLMFVQIFSMATTAVSRQKGMAELDQAARTLTTVLTNDLHNRTFRDVQPFWQNQAVTANQRRRGYFYISENDPRSDTDDVLQLTIDVNNTLVRGTPFARGDSNARRDPSRRDPLLYGKTVQLAEPSPDPDPQVQTANQPDSDDGSYKWRDPVTNAVMGFDPDGLGASQFAEVSYFLRNGNLYRRVLLIRQPYNDAWDQQPEGITGAYDATDTTNSDGHFWRDFDYSAWFDAASPSVVFCATDYIENHDTQPTNAAGIPLSLGVPHLRFGHTVYRNTSGVNPLPREFLTYLDPSAPNDWPFPYTAPRPANNFIGRFTVNECSHDDFGYPGRIPVDGSGALRNPMDPETTLSFDDRFTVSEYANQNRRGDDILLSNVHSFDVKVWDDVIGEFLDLGHDRADSGGVEGRFHRNRNTNNAYGNRFDTWHPLAPDATPYYPSEPPTTAGTPGGSLPIEGAQERPLRAVRITVRYHDVSSGMMRNVVRDFPLVDSGI